MAPGDADVNELRFDFEWEDPGGAAGPELRATWARLQICIGDRAVTRVVDSRTRSARTSIYLPLYPLAEWMASHWWALLHEVETQPRTADGYERRHSLEFAREGFALPRLALHPMNGAIELIWAEHEPADSRVRFIERGRCILQAEEVEESLRRLIEIVIRRLEDQGIEDTFLQREWSTAALDPDEEEFCRLVGALGLDPFSLDEETESRILQAAEILDPALREEFFDAASDVSLLEQATLVRDGLEAIRTSDYDLKPLEELRTNTERAGSANLAPWEEGYAFARRLRERLNLQGRTARSMEELASFFSLDAPDLRTAVLDASALGSGFSPTPRTAFLDGLVGVNLKGAPSFLIPKHREASRMFAFCRALFEFLAGSDGGNALITFAHSTRQQRNRAFAAEFLAPAELLRDRLSANVIDDEQVEDLAGQFGVSSYVIRHQLENHSLARILPL